MSLFDRFKKKAEEVAGGVWRQVNPLDGGKTYSNPTGQPRPVQQPAAQAPTSQPNRTNQVRQMLGSTRTNAFANNIKPATPTPIQTPNLRVNMPSYGSGLNGAFNKFKDNFDANTPQDQFKRNQQVQAPLRPNMNYQQQQQVAPSNLTKVVNLANSAKNNAITPMATASKIAVGQITGNQQARNNALDTYKQGVKSNLNTLNSFKEGIIGSSKQIGTGLAYQSKDFQNAQKAQTNLVDIQNQQKLNAIKRAKQGFNTQQDVDRFMNYANNLWQNEAESRQAQIDIQKEQQKQLDPTRNALAIADAGLTALSFGVAGPTKNLSQAAGKQAFQQAVEKGLTKQVATQLAKKAATNEIIRQSALTGSMGGFQGSINPYITKDPGTITPTDVITGAVSGGVMGGVLPGAFVGASKAAKPVQNALNDLQQTVVNKANQLTPQPTAVTPDGMRISVPKAPNNTEANFAKRVTPDGNRYVELDRQMLANAPQEKWSKIIKDTIAEKFQGKKYPVGGDKNNQALVNARTKSELAFKQPTMDNTAFMQKGNMTDNLDELISTMHDIRTVRNKKPNQKSTVSHYISGRVPVKVGDTTLYPRVDIEVSKNGSKAVYDIADIKEFPGWDKVAPNRGDQILIDNQETRSGNIVPQNSQNVNPIRGLDRFKLNQKGSIKNPLYKEDPLEALKAEANNIRTKRQTFDQKLSEEYRKKSQGLNEADAKKLRESYQKRFEQEAPSLNDVEKRLEDFKANERADKTTSDTVKRLIKESHSQNTYDPKNTGYFVNLTPENIKGVTPLKGIDDYGDSLWVKTKNGVSEVKVQDWSDSGQGFRVSQGNGNEIARFNTREEAVDFAKKVLTIESEASRQGKRVILPGSLTEPRTQPTPPVQKPKTATGGPDASTVATATTVKKQRPVVQQIPEESPYPLAKTQTTTPQGPPPTKFDDQMALGPGQTKKTRFADKTVPKSEFVSEKIKGSIKTPEYNVQTEKQGYTSALSRLKKEGDAKFETQVFDNLDKKKGTISRQEAIDAQTLAAVLDGGDDASIRKATAIYEKLSEHYTAAGQLTQAAAILARRSPEGLRAYATTAFKNSGVKITPQLEQELTKLIQAVREASPQALPRAQWDVMNFVAKKTPTSFGDKVINTWRAGLLTAPTTTGGNILGNSGEALVRKGFVNPVATAADAVMGAFTGKRTMTLAKGGSATKGAAEGTGMLKEYLKSGYDPRVNNTKYDAPRSINTGIKALDTYINGTYRLMGVADMPFSTLAEKEALSSLAKAEAINKGLKGKARTDFVNEFMKNPPDTALARAQQEADYATFKNPTMLGKAATGMKRPLGAVGDFFVPFTQVPASIATRIVERTPIGTANNIVKQLIEVKKNGGQFDQRALSQSIGNGMFGPAVFGVGYALAGNDQLTFGYPKDNTERKLWDSEGKQPYSVKVGNRWYSLNYLQPFGTLLAIGGQARQAANEGKSIDEIIFQGGATAGQSVMNQSFLKGIGGALDAIGDPERSLNKYIEQTTSSVVPNFIRSYARAADDKQRQPIGIVEGVKSGVPGLRKDTTPKLDAFGKPLPAKDTFLNQYVNPLKPSIARTSPTVEELRRLKDANLSTMPTEGDTTTFGKNNKIDKKQLKDLNGAIGSRVGEAWDKIIASPEYKSMSDENKKKALDAAKKDYGAVAKAEWAAKNNKMNDMWQPNLTKKQQDIATGLSPDYLTVSKPKEKVVKSKYSQEVQDFAKLSNTEKNAYFRRDPVKAKQLYDQSKKMEAELGTKSKTSKASTKKASTKKTAKKSTKGRKIARGKMPKFISVTNGKRMNLMVSKVKYSPVQKPKMAKVKTTKTIAKKSKIA